jgi:hypothetical protein
MVRPDATKVQGSPSFGAALILTVMDIPSASFICDATVRIQISS